MHVETPSIAVASWRQFKSVASQPWRSRHWLVVFVISAMLEVWLDGICGDGNRR